MSVKWYFVWTKSIEQ